jgi:hypothetical protein
MAVVTFKAQLAECRKIVAEEPDDGWRDFTLQLLDRWRRDARANTTWETIEKTSMRGEQKPLWPGDLVEWVIDRAREQKRLVEEVVPQSAHREKRVLSEAEKNWRASRKGDGDLALLAGLQSRAALGASRRPAARPGPPAKPPKIVHQGLP